MSAKRVLSRDKRVLLSNEQIENLTNELLEELDNIPGSDDDKRRRLIVESIKNIESMIAANIKVIYTDNPDCSVEEIVGYITRDKLKR